VPLLPDAETVSRVLEDATCTSTYCGSGTAPPATALKASLVGVMVMPVPPSSNIIAAFAAKVNKHAPRVMGIRECR
jgi:hypothetical protein